MQFLIDRGIDLTIRDYAGTLLHKAGRAWR
jgi:hypothetical protein